MFVLWRPSNHDIPWRNASKKKTVSQSSEILFHICMLQGKLGKSCHSAVHKFHFERKLRAVMCGIDICWTFEAKKKCKVVLSTWFSTHSCTPSNLVSHALLHSFHPRFPCTPALISLFNPSTGSCWSSRLKFPTSAKLPPSDVKRELSFEIVATIGMLLLKNIYFAGFAFN